MEYKESTRVKQQNEAKFRARKIWNNSEVADENHEYLRRKCVKAFRIRQGKKKLIIPVMDANNKIMSLQFIDSTGEKKFLPGGKIKNGQFIIGDVSKSNKIYICEGYATGASIHMVTEQCVISTFSAWNIQ